jgi:hypothetical protein
MSMSNKKPWEWLEEDYGEVKKKMKFEQIKSSSEQTKMEFQQNFIVLRCACNTCSRSIVLIEMLTNF